MIADKLRQAAECFNAREFARAATLCEEALALEPANAAAHVALGAALQELGRREEAMARFRRAVELDGGLASAHHNLGNMLLEEGAPEQAAESFERAIALDPEYAAARCGFGNALQALGNRDEAVAQYQRALALEPASVDAAYNLALARLFRQEFEQAWPAYERRFERADMRRHFRQPAATIELFERLPRWQGVQERFSGKVGIWAEQGIGDQILCSTLIPELARANVPFLYEVDARLLPAYRRAFPGAQFVPVGDPPAQALQHAARVLPAGSLPNLFRRSREDFSRQPRSLLSAAPDRRAAYRQRLDGLGPGLKVALAWRSTRKGNIGARKTAALADFAPLLRLPGAHFVDVQYGDTSAERRAVEAALGIRIERFDEVDHFDDLECVLAILDACDILITTSNATAHFAGALGKRTWLLFPRDHAPFHYWAHGGHHRCLWYPSVEIHPSAHFAEWGPLIEDVARRLAREKTGGADRGDASGRPDRGAQGLHAWHEQGGRLRRQGRLDEAVEVLQHALGEAPGDARVLSELAHALRWKGRPDQALRAASRAVEIEPGLAGAWFNLGAARVELHDTVAGIEAYRKALECQPDFAEAWSNLGEAYGSLGDKAAELNAYRRAVAVNPGLAPAWSNLGSALQQAGRVQEALSSCRRATELDPEFAGGWNNLAYALQACGEHAGAVEACEAALRLAPALGEAWGTLGAVLHSLRRYDEAIHAHQKAIEIMPGVARLHFNLGLTLQHCGRGAEAIASFRRALALDPGDAQAHWDLAFALLGSGQLREGWEAYEWRWRRPGADRKRYEFGAWDGDTSRPRRLLVWAEQGIGDQILYAGMVPGLARSALSVTLEVDSRLVPLYRRSFPEVAVIPRDDIPAAHAGDYDCEVPMGSLGRWLRPSFERFPRHGGYLKAAQERADEYRRILLEGAPGATRLVGVSWRSSNREFGSFKSTALPDWSVVLRVPGIRFVDLQYGDTAAERALVEARTGARVEHVAGLDLYHDLEGLAALCAACDRVITVSNVTAHMAGALGRPLWMLAPQGNGRLWYWFSGRTDSPWYPSMRVFTQQTQGNWSQVLAAVEKELAGFAGHQ